MFCSLVFAMFGAMFRTLQKKADVLIAGWLAQMGECPSAGSRGPRFDSRCLSVLELGSPAGLIGRGVGSHALPVALREEQEPPVNGKARSSYGGGEKKITWNAPLYVIYLPCQCFLNNTT